MNKITVGLLDRLLIILNLSRPRDYESFHNGAQKIILI